MSTVYKLRGWIAKLSSRIVVLGFFSTGDMYDFALSLPIHNNIIQCEFSVCVCKKKKNIQNVTGWLTVQKVTGCSIKG